MLRTSEGFGAVAVTARSRAGLSFYRAVWRPDTAAVPAVRVLGEMTGCTEAGMAARLCAAAMLLVLSTQCLASAR